MQSGARGSNVCLKLLLTTHLLEGVFQLAVWSRGPQMLSKDASNWLLVRRVFAVHSDFWA